MVQRLPLPRAKAPDTRIKRHEVSLLLILISQFHLSSLIGEMSRQRKKHQCSVCPKSFTTSANLKHHQAVHRGEKPNRCKSCFKGFTRPVDLSRHRNEVHLDVRKVVCPGCDKGFGRSSLLLRHLRGTTAEPCRRSTINDTSVDVAASTGLDMPGGYPFLPVAHVASAAEVIESDTQDVLVDAPQQVSVGPNHAHDLGSVFRGFSAARRHSDPLMRYVPDFHSLYDWYLVVRGVSLKSIGRIISADITSTDNLFDRVPVAPETYNICLLGPFGGRSRDTFHRIAASLGDMNKVAQQLIIHGELPPLRLIVNMLLVLNLLFHDIEAVKTHVRFIRYLYRHFEQHGSCVRENSMRSVHRQKISIGMWSSSGHHFLPIHEVNSLQKAIERGKLSVDRQTIQDALNGFVVDLSSFELEFFF